MQKFVFENNGTNTFLSYIVREEDEIDSMSLGMITNNNINGFAKSVFTQVDDKKYIKYNISAKVPARQFLAGIVNKKRLLGVFNGIVDAIISAEEYMIDVRSIILNLDYIFTDVSTCETCLICLPVINLESKEIDVRAFFKTTMFSTSFDQSENCDYVAQIINYLNSSTVFSLEDFKKVLLGLSANNTQNTPASLKQPVVATTRAQPKSNQNNQQSFQQYNNQIAQQPSTQKAVTSTAINNGQQSPNITGIQIPQPNNRFEPAQNMPASVGATVEKEEEISWFYLMQHYNKENAERYKRQQEAKKLAKGQAKSQKEKKDKKEKKAAPPVMPGFAIPGQQQSINRMPAMPQPKQQAAPQPMAAPRPMTPPQPQQPGYPPAPQSSYPPVQQPVMQQPPIKGNFGETTVLGGAGGRIGETTVLNANTEAPQINPRLIRAKNNERININKPVFRIGKERSYVDYFIGDNPAISRSHANIVERNGAYFLVDTNSTNHTYINGGIIQPNTEVRLSHGAKVRFANEEFEFQLY